MKEEEQHARREQGEEPETGQLRVQRGFTVVEGERSRPESPWRVDDPSSARDATGRAQPEDRQDGEEPAEADHGEQGPDGRDREGADARRGGDARGGMPGGLRQGAATLQPVLQLLPMPLAKGDSVARKGGHCSARGAAEVVSRLCCCSSIIDENRIPREG